MRGLLYMFCVWTLHKGVHFVSVVQLVSLNVCHSAMQRSAQGGGETINILKCVWF